ERAGGGVPLEGDLEGAREPALRIEQAGEGGGRLEHPERRGPGEEDEIDRGCECPVGPRRGGVPPSPAGAAPSGEQERERARGEVGYEKRNLCPDEGADEAVPPDLRHDVVVGA